MTIPSLFFSLSEKTIHQVAEIRQKRSTDATLQKKFKALIWTILFITIFFFAPRDTVKML